MSLMLASSHSSRVEHRLLAGAVAPERALLADRIGTLEDPVLPGGEAGEDFRLHGLGATEAPGGLEPGQTVRGKAPALLQAHAAPALVVHFIPRERGQAGPLAGPPP